MELKLTLFVSQAGENFCDGHTLFVDHKVCAEKVPGEKSLTNCNLSLHFVTSFFSTQCSIISV